MPSDQLTDYSRKGGKGKEGERGGKRGKEGEGGGKERERRGEGGEGEGGLFPSPFSLPPSSLHPPPQERARSRSPAFVCAHMRARMQRKEMTTRVSERARGMHAQRAARVAPPPCRSVVRGRKSRVQSGDRLGEAPCELATPRATPCERTCFSYNTRHTNTQTLPPIRARVTRKGIEPFLRRGASTMPRAGVGIAGLRLGKTPCELATPRATPCERTCFSYERSMPTTSLVRASIPAISNNSTDLGSCIMTHWSIAHPTHSARHGLSTPRP